MTCPDCGGQVSALLRCERCGVDVLAREASSAGSPTALRESGAHRLVAFLRRDARAAQFPPAPDLSAAERRGERAGRITGFWLGALILLGVLAIVAGIVFGVLLRR